MSRLKILVVDDSATARMLGKAALGREPYEVVVATDGAHAVAVAKQERPNLILMDVMMPGMDGFAACRAIRADEETRDIPVIMVTTRGEPVNVEQGFASGCNDYVTKPMNSIELVTKIKNLLGQ
jgi:CheY-like chemotaxis protein